MFVNYIKGGILRNKQKCSSKPHLIINEDYKLLTSFLEDRLEHEPEET